MFSVQGAFLLAVYKGIFGMTEKIEIAALLLVAMTFMVGAYCHTPLHLHRQARRLSYGWLGIKGGHSSKVCPPFNANQLTANGLKSLLLF